MVKMMQSWITKINCSVERLSKGSSLKGYLWRIVGTYDVFICKWILSQDKQSMGPYIIYMCFYGEKFLSLHSKTDNKEF